MKAKQKGFNMGKVDVCQILGCKSGITLTYLSKACLPGLFNNRSWGDFQYESQAKRFQHGQSRCLPNSRTTHLE